MDFWIKNTAKPNGMTKMKKEKESLSESVCKRERGGGERGREGEREREGERGREGERERGREGERGRERENPFGQ